jgi:hypothetical protein
VSPQSVAEPAAQTREEEGRGASPFAVGVLTLSVLLLYFWLSGSLFAGEMPDFWMSSAQTTGMVLTYATSPAFLLASLLYAQRRTRANLDQLVRSGSLSREAAATRGVSGDSFSLAQNVTVTIVGFILGSLNVPWELVAESLDSPWRFAAVSIAVGNVLTWIAVAHCTFRRIVVSIFIRRLGRDHAEVDLLRLDALLPFGRIGTLHVLIVAIAVSSAAFQSLDAELRWDNYSAALAAGISSGAALLLLPMLGIRQNVRLAKRRALEKLDEAIAHANRDLEPNALRYLGDLLRRRETIEQAREWPLDTTSVSRIAIYFVIPPIAWVGGALVEIMLQAAI